MIDFFNLKYINKYKNNIKQIKRYRDKPSV